MDRRPSASRRKCYHAAVVETQTSSVEFQCHVPFLLGRLVKPTSSYDSTKVSGSEWGLGRNGLLNHLKPKWEGD